VNELVKSLGPLDFTASSVVQFVLFIAADPATRAAAATALRFATAALAAGHGVRQVFFHGDGAHALAPPEPRAGEPDVVGDWRRLAATHGFPLLACETAATRRGVIANGRGASAGTLGQLMMALGEEDTRLVEFPG
jgi:sulfur relay protein TusD/DsrE